MFLLHMAFEVVVSTDEIAANYTEVPTGWNFVSKNRSIVRVLASDMSKHIISAGKLPDTRNNTFISCFAGHGWIVFLLIVPAATSQSRRASKTHLVVTEGS